MMKCYFLSNCIFECRNQVFEERTSSDIYMHTHTPVVTRELRGAKTNCKYMHNEGTQNFTVRAFACGLPTRGPSNH